MINNDILRRIRFALDLSDPDLIRHIRQGLEANGSEKSLAVDKESIVRWLSKESDPNFQTCPDVVMHAFLDGLILENRGPSQPSKADSGAKTAEGQQAAALTNNLILKKLRIALAMRSDDMLADLARAGMALSASEFSAFFRSPQHRKFKSCGDQVLRRFLQGLVIRMRPDKADLPGGQPGAEADSDSASKGLE